MFNDEATKVEQPAIDALTKLGWRYVTGLMPGAAHASFRDVVLVDHLEQALRKLNPWINEENLRKVMRELTHPNHAVLMEYNHALYGMLVNYLSVEQDLGKGRKGQTVKTIDFDHPANNDFLCTNQFKI